jgi:UTP--glucose-1-phosphate uridylyltransferase
MSIQVAVIPAAGRGTRMRPATRVVPKSLITVIDRPAIQYAVEEAARAGASEAVLIVDLDTGHLVQQHFMAEGGLPGLEDIKVRPWVQAEPLGLGHAVLEAQEFVRDRPFFCLLADNLVRPGADVLPDLAKAYDGDSVVCLRRLSDEYLDRYGVIVPGEQRSDRVIEVRGAIEKPGLDAAPSRLGLIGRYLFTPEVFQVLAKLEPGHGGEIQLTDAIDALGMAGRCLGSIADDDLLDVGTPFGLAEATSVLGVAHPEWGEEFRELARRVVSS